MVVKGNEDELCRERGVTSQIVDLYGNKQLNWVWFGNMGVSQGGKKSTT